MAKKWAEVESSEQYQKLSPDQQELARQQYFDQVITPQLPKEQIDAAKKEFLADTAPKQAAEVQPQAQTAQPEQAEPQKPEPSFLQKAVAAPIAGALKGIGAVKEAAGAIAEPIYSLAGSAVGKTVGELGGLTSIPLHAAGLTPGGREPEQTKKEVEETFRYEPKTKAGGSEYNPLNVVPQAIGKAIAAVSPEKAKSGENLTLEGGIRNFASEFVPQVISLGLAKFAPKVSKPIETAQKAAEQSAKNLMQSAIKPTKKALKTGDAAIAVDTMLEKGIPATPKGLEQIRSRIDDLNDQIENKIKNSTEKIRLAEVARPLVQKLQQLKKQVNPNSDIEAVKNSWQQLRNHPLLAGGTEIPVQLAQELKQGTYKQLRKKYGEAGTASTEAQKSLARGLKEGIAKKVPEVGGLNAEESRLLKTLSVAEHRILMEANKNPMGLSLIAKNPAAWAAFMADRSAPFKSLLAKTLYNSSKKLAGPAFKEALTKGTKGAAATVPSQPRTDQTQADEFE